MAKDNGISGYYVLGSYRNSFTSNTAQNNANSGFRVSGSEYNTFAGNTSSGNTSHGIVVFSSSSFNTITGNTLNNNTAYGISLSASHSNTASGNTMSGNANGIVLATATKNTVSGNTISNSSSFGINLVTSSDNNIISTNMISDSGGATNNYAIVINDSDFTTVDANTITDSSATTLNNAMYIYSTAISTYLSGNTFSSTPGTSILNDASTSTIFASQTTAEGGLNAVYRQASSTSAFQIQNAGGTALLTADTSTSTIVIGNSGNTVTFGATGILLAGTARPDVKVTLAPEFQGATFAGDGSNNNGSLSSDFCSGSSRQNINTAVCAATETHNYYAWTTTQASAQDYDVYVRYQMPSDYDTGSMTNLRIWGWGTTGANEIVTIAMNVDGSGTACSTSSDAITSNTTWQQVTTASPLGACTPAAGDMVTFKVRVAAGQNNFARAGEIEFSYKKKY